MKSMCIYHGNCVDGFAAAWVVRKALGADHVDFIPGFYGQPAPDVSDRNVIMVDFSYKRPVLEEMACDAHSILILDHHKTAQVDLAGFIKAPSFAAWHHAHDGERLSQNVRVASLFDMDRSGAGIAWDYFFPGQPRPKMLDHIEDRDLWRFSLPESRDLHACVVSHPYDFATWDALIARAELPMALHRMAKEGEAIDRKLQRDIAELLGVATRRMVIGGISVPVANLPYMMASDGAGKLAEDAPFAATYFDKADARIFSLRSRGAGGVDVAEIAARYGGGGHRNAAGFQMPIGWEGDK